MAKCSECGFLTLHTSWLSDIRPLQLVEADEEVRTKHKVVRTAMYESRPLCFMRIPRFAEEVPSVGFAKEYPFLSEEWDCPEYTPWQQRSSPKEHRKMLDRKWMLQWQTEREEADRQHRRTELRWVVGGVIAVVIAAAIGAAAIVVGAYIEREGQPTIVNQIVVPTPSTLETSGSPQQ